MSQDCAIVTSLGNKSETPSQKKNRVMSSSQKEQACENDVRDIPTEDPYEQVEETLI